LGDKEIMSTRIYVRKEAEVPKEGFLQKLFGWLFGW